MCFGGEPAVRGVAALIAAVLLVGAPARALVVEADPEDARHAPGRGTGFDHVGHIGGTSGVYVGDGWVLTAAHVGAGDLWLEGVRYPAVSDSWVRLRGEAGAAPPDLGLFRVEPAPRLPRLEIARRPPKLADPLLLVGCGLGRGEVFEWEGRPGWRWAAPAVCRWGRNQVAAVSIDMQEPGVATSVFVTLFSEGEPEEAQAAVGDSGGAGFAPGRGGWVLAGIMISVRSFPRQPAQTSVIGNATHLADLSRYRAEIRAAMGLAPDESAAGR
jgi:hypothetical protein